MSKEVTLSPFLVPIDNGPHRLVVDEKSGFIFVSCKKSNSVMVIDGPNNRIKQRIEIKSPDDLKIDKSSSILYIKNKDNIYKIDIGINSRYPIKDSFSVRADGEMVLDPVRNLIYIYHKSYPGMDVIDANSGNLLKVMGTKEKSWGMAIDSSTNKMYVTNARWLDNIIVDLDNGKIVGKLYLPKEFPGASLLDAVDIRDYVDWFNRRIIVDEVEKRVYIVYPYLKETISSLVTDFGMGGIPIDWSTRHELLAVYDATTDELIDSILLDGITEVCLDSVNSRLYWYAPLVNRIDVLDKDGKILERISITKPSNPNDIFTNSNIHFSIEDIPFFGEYPLHSKNKRHGFDVDSKLNKLYLTLEGKSKDFLAILNLN